MARTLGVLVFSLSLVVLLVGSFGCADKPIAEYPTQEIDDADAALAKARGVNAEKWAPEEYRSAEEKLEEAERLAIKTTWVKEFYSPDHHYYFRDGYFRRAAAGGARLAAIEARRKAELAYQLALAAQAEADKPVLSGTVFTVTDVCSGDALPARVSVQPAGGEVTVLDAADGTASAELSAGAIEVTAVAAGYEPKTLAGTLVEGEDATFEFKLYKKIKKTGKIHFEVGSARIQPRSFGVLDDVIRQINALCQVDKLIIEGHTDADGDAEYNKRLSGWRAEAVRRYFVAKGVDETKLEIVPFGEDQPIADNETDAGKSKNRRVEFRLQ